MHVRKKIGKIVEELTMYFFDMGAKQIESKIVKNGKVFEITFVADYKPENHDDLLCLEKYLNEPKNEGIEDIYWELAGSGEPGESSQLLLIGMMIDRARIDIRDDKVELKLYKEMKEF